MPRLESDESVEFLGCFDGSAIRLELDTARPFLSLARPGHTDETTIGRERERNPFVRVWSGADPEGTERVRVGSRDATLIVWSPD